jgi:hypothetical protein
MTERGERVGRRREAVHERGRADRRLAHGGEVELEAERGAERDPLERSDLHEDLVRVLAIVERLVLPGLAGLEQVRVSVAR